MTCSQCDELSEVQSCDPGTDCFCACHACWNCGELGCPGYCDDYQTYNLRPAETGGAAAGD
jgi:hypothetical protein